MEAHETPRKGLSEEAARKAIQSIKGGNPSADAEPFKGDLPPKMPDRFRNAR